MYLASLTDIRSQLGFDDMTDINAAIGDALDAVEIQLSAALRTEFDQVTLTDTFYIDKSVHMGRAVYNEILLTRGFLQGQPTTVITNEISPIFLTAFDEVQSIYGGSGGPTPNFVFGTLDLERGVGKDTTNDYHASYINITYTAGFAPDDTADPAISYVLDDGTHPTGSVPKWLQQLAKQMTLILLADAAVVTEAGIVINTKIAQQQAQLMISRKIRYAPVALNPLSSTESV